jgi:hypothetical protein
MFMDFATEPIPLDCIGPYSASTLFFGSTIDDDAIGFVEFGFELLWGKVDLGAKKHARSFKVQDGDFFLSQKIVEIALKH